MKKTEMPTRIDLFAVAATLLFVLCLFPVLSQGRQDAKRAVCIANVSTLGRAWLMYAHDNGNHLVNGHVPRSAYYANESYWLGQGYRDNAWWVNPPHDESGYFTGMDSHLPDSLLDMEDEFRGIRSGKLFPYLGATTAYHCPAEKGYLGLEYGRSGWRTYSIIGPMNGERLGGVEPVWQLGQIAVPGQQLVFIENLDIRGWNIGSWIMGGGSHPTWIDPFFVGHGRQSVLSFADGHIETHSWVDPSTISNSESSYGGTFIRDPIALGQGTDIRYMNSIYVPTAP